MIKSGASAWKARSLKLNDRSSEDTPVWSYQRFGKSTTILNDGKIIEIAGEHEDYYDSDFCTLFPRMWSTQGNHVSGYKNWGEVKGDRIKRRKPNGEMEVITKPTFGENLRFMRRFQMGHLYFPQGNQDYR